MGLKDPVGAAFRNHPTLREFYFHDDFDEDTVDGRVKKMFWRGGFEKLETLVVSSSVHSEAETVIQRLEIPPLPNLRTLIYPCRDFAWSMGDPMGYDTTSAPETIEATSLEQLRRASHLERIIFAEVSPHTFDYDPLEVDKWCERRINGIIIRWYTNGTEEFIHTRRMELAEFDSPFYDPNVAVDCGFGGPIIQPPCEGEECYEHEWIEQTSFGGYWVDDDVIEKVYEIIGESGKWTTGGRDLNLPEEAWEALRKGRSEQDDEPWWDDPVFVDDSVLSEDEDGDPTEMTPSHVDDWFAEHDAGYYDGEDWDSDDDMW